MQEDYRGQDPSSAFSTALTTGLVSAGISYAGMHAQADFNADYLAALNS